MSDTPEIGAKIRLSGSDEIEEEFERIRLRAESTFSRIDASVRTTSSESQASVRAGADVARVAVEDSTQQVGTLQRVAEAIGSTASWVTERVKEIALVSGLAGAGLSAGYAAAYVALDMWSTKSAQEGEDLLHISAAAGVSVEALTRWSYAADIASGTSDQVSASFKKVSDSLIAYQDKGDESALGLFKQVGLAGEVSTGKIKTAEQVFERLGEKLKDIADPARRAKAAFDLLGGGAKELLPVFEKNAKDLAALQAEAKEMGETKASDLSGNTKLLEDKRRLNMALEDLKDSFATAFFPIFAEGAGKTAEWINKSKVQIEEFVEGAADKFKELKEDVGKLFGSSLSERIRISVDGQKIDLDKNRMIGLVQQGREAGKALEEAAADGEEAAEEAADAKVQISADELDNFIKVGNAKIQFDENLKKRFTEIDGQRVEVTKSNATKIVSALSSNVEKALEAVTSSSAKNMRFNSSFMAALYRPAQEIRALVLDTMDAISGKGWGGRSATIALISRSYDAVADAVGRLRVATLALFGMTVDDLPTVGQAFDYLLKAFESFRSALYGEDKKSTSDIGWARDVGSAASDVIDVLKIVGEATLVAVGFLLYLARVTLPYVADAFKATRAIITGNPIADENSLAWLNAWTPLLRQTFASIIDIVSGFYKAVRAKLATLFKGVTVDDGAAAISGAIKAVFDTMEFAIANTVAALEKLWAYFLVIEPYFNDVLFALGYGGDWKRFAISALVGYLLTNIDPLNAFWSRMITAAVAFGFVAIGAFAGITAIVAALIGVPAWVAAGIVLSLTYITYQIYKHWDDIKAAGAVVVDYLIEKWSKFTKYFTDKVLPLLGVTRFKSDDAKAAEKKEADDLKAATDKPGAPSKGPSGQIVLGTDKVYREESAEAERTGMGAGAKASAAAKAKSDYDALREERERAFMASLSNGRPEGAVGAEKVTSGVMFERQAMGDFISSLQALGTPGALTGTAKPAADKPADFKGAISDINSSLRAMREKTGEKTPFAEGPMATPQAPAGPGLVPFQPVIIPDDKTLYGSPEAVANLLKQLEAAGLVVKTPRPREM